MWGALTGNPAAEILSRDEQTKDAIAMLNQNAERQPSSLDPPVSISHVVRTLQSYLPVIALALGAVILGYLIVAVALHLFGPSQRVTSVQFRVDFKGAEHGLYPNRTRFSSNEIIAAPVLIEVFKANRLDRFTTFADFTESLFVLESNPARERLERAYRSQLADPKLSPLDRDRIQREYDLKAASLNKNLYSLNYIRAPEVKSIPELVARKVLNDILNGWAEFVSRDQHVLEYRVALLSPSALVSSPLGDEDDPIIAALMLRSTVMRIQTNIGSMRGIPAAELVRTRKDSLSLFDIGTRLDDILRFRLDPLVNSIATSGMLTDRARTIQFLETKLRFDQRQLEAQKEVASVAREALLIYRSGGAAADQADLERNALPARDGSTATSQNETVMPQLSESFLERLIQMTTNSADTEYRQRLTDEYRAAALGIVPLQDAVSYDTTLLETVRSRGVGGAGLTRQIVNGQLSATREEVRHAAAAIQEIYATLSVGLNPSKQLLTRIGAPATHTVRSVGMKRLAIYGLLVTCLALPIIVIVCLIHNRMREEEAARRPLSAAAEPAP
jgi:hypothetical protein